MRLIQPILAYIEAHPYLSRWPDAQAVLSGYEYPPTAEPMPALPMLCCQAAGGYRASAVPLAAGFTLLNLASEVLDDFQDQDPGMPWARWPPNRVFMATLALIFLAQSCLSRLETEEAALREIIDTYAQIGLVSSVGQNIPRPGQVLSLEDYWVHVQAKSGLVFSVGAWSGVRLTTSEKVPLVAARDFGLALGTLSQIVDDCQDFVASTASFHPTEYFTSLPVILALEHNDHPHHHELVQLVGRPAQGDARWHKDIRDLVIEMNGLGAAFGVAKVYEQKALPALSQFERKQCVELHEYVQQHVRFAEIQD